MRFAESIIGLFKAEVIHPQGPWRSVETVEYAVLRWVDWFNNRRLPEPIGDVPSIEFEQAYYRHREGHATVERLKQESLRRSRRGSKDYLLISRPWFESVRSGQSVKFVERSREVSIFIGKRPG